MPEHWNDKNPDLLQFHHQKKHHINEWNTRLTPILCLFWARVWLQGKKNLSLNMCVKPTVYLVCDQNDPTIQFSFSLFNIFYHFHGYIFNGFTNNKIWPVDVGESKRPKMLLLLLLLLVAVFQSNSIKGPTYRKLSSHNARIENLANIVIHGQIYN